MRSKPRKPAAVCPCDPPPRKPGKAYAACSVPGCGCQVVSGKCRAHARSSTTTGERYRDSYADNPSDLTRWRRLSTAYLRDHPLCESERCSAIPAPLRPAARQVDHIDALALKGPRAWDPDNWQALCVPCHSRKTAGETFGR
ncbi:HNH endonuclease [Streptomyces sp. NPDC002758]